MSELIKDEKNISEKDGKVLISVEQIQQFDKDAFKKIVEQWHKALKDNTEKLKNLDKVRKENHDKINSTLDKQKNEMQKIKIMQIEEFKEFLLKDADERLKKEQENCEKFLEDFEKIKSGEIDKMNEYFDFLKKDLEKNVENLTKTLELYDKKEYYDC